jgi:hypothetical protein
MATDRNHLSEEELNRQRKAQHEAERHEDDGIVETVDRAFQSAVSPIATSDEPDEDELQEQRELNDEATRES